MVEAASSMSMCSPVETKESDWAMLTRACVVSFLKVVDRSSALGMKIPKSTYVWIRHHRRMCLVSFLKA
jgi:hypothetical protein